MTKAARQGWGGSWSYRRRSRSHVRPMIVSTITEPITAKVSSA